MRGPHIFAKFSVISNFCTILELMVDLHEAILQIGRHFIANDAKFMKSSLEPDFSIESHERDHEKFAQGISNGIRRAKALFGELLTYFAFKFSQITNRKLTDFERRDDDELGFRKSDILIILNSKDEHCWIGELNGLRSVTNLARKNSV